MIKYSLFFALYFVIAMACITRIPGSSGYLIAVIIVGFMALSIGILGGRHP